MIYRLVSIVVIRNRQLSTWLLFHKTCLFYSKKLVPIFTIATIELPEKINENRIRNVAQVRLWIYNKADKQTHKKQFQFAKLNSTSEYTKFD